MENQELDILLKAYRDAVEEWIATIRKEEGLANENHTVHAVDSWEAAGFAEEEARGRAKAAKTAYEDGLRKSMFQI
jgi:hypothetical protein